MLPLLLFLCLGLLILVLYEIRERRGRSAQGGRSEQGADSAAVVQRSDRLSSDDGECCGQHLVCERESLLQTNAVVEYYDDEELDVLAGIAPTDYTSAQHDSIEEVFSTLQERDVPGWVRSMQLRNIALPPDIREQALLIVRERRQKA